jgi:hypothetical protein
MKLFVSALLLVAASATVAGAQEYVPPQGAQNGSGVATITVEPAQNGTHLSPKETAALAQAQAMVQAQMQGLRTQMPQAGCPLYLTSARLNWPASYLPVTSAEKVTEPNLALGFRNSSGKAIRSATITARFLGKQSVYQLDADAFDLRLTFSGVDAADKAAEQLREIRVPEKMYAFGVTRVSLEQVTFADGTFWVAGMGGGRCSLNVQGSAERVVK